MQMWDFKCNNKIIVVSKARDSTKNTINSLCYTQSPLTPVLIIPELGSSGRGGANPLLTKPLWRIRNFHKVVLHGGFC